MYFQILYSRILIDLKKKCFAMFLYNKCVTILGNYSLARVLPQIYLVNKEPIHDHVMALVSLLPQCENSEKLSLLNLFGLIAKHKPSVSTFTFLG